MPDDQPDRSPAPSDDELYGVHEGGGWISGPCIGGPDPEDRERWLRLNSGGHWQGDAEPAEGDDPAKS